MVRSQGASEAKPRTGGGGGRASGSPLVRRGAVALVGTLVGAVVHLALVPTHWREERTVARFFIVDALGFGLASIWTFTARRHWDVLASVMLAGTVAAYGVVSAERPRGRGPRRAARRRTVELAAAFVVVASVFTSVTSARAGMRWTTAAIGIALVSMLGTNGIVGASVSSTSDAPARPPAGGTGMPGMQGMPGMSGTPAPGAPLALATTSPAGPITWPDDMSSMAAGMQMATPDCTTPPTKAQQQAAILDLVDQTVQAVAPYSSLAAAKAAGYVPVTRSGRKIVHYINPSIYRQGPTIDPHAIPVLVYVNTADGVVLSAAMYLMPASADAVNPPQPGGCLTQWHIHSDLCFSGGSVVGNDATGRARPAARTGRRHP